MTDIKRVTLGSKTDPNSDRKQVEIEHDNDQQAMALAEAANEGWYAIGASSVFTSYAVTLVKDGEPPRTLRVKARDVMGAKAVSEEHLVGYEMTECREL